MGFISILFVFLFQGSAEVDIIKILVFQTPKTWKT